MDPYRRYDSGSYSPSRSNHYPNPAYPNNYTLPFPSQHPSPPPPPPNYSYEGYWVDTHFCPPYLSPPPHTQYRPTKSSPVGWPSYALFTQGLYPYPRQESFHHDSSTHQYHQTSDSYTQLGHPSPKLHSEIGHQSGRWPSYSSQTPHVETNASFSPSTSASMYPLDNLMFEMRLLDNHQPFDSSSPGGSFHRPYLMPCQSSHNSDSSSPSFSINQGSFSSHSFQHGKYLFNSYDNNSISSDFALVQNQIVPFDPSEKSLRVVLLHGTLDIWVYETKILPKMDLFSERLWQVFEKTGSRKMTAKIEESVSNQNVIASDPYVSICLSSAIVARTRVISKDQNPVWTQHFSIHVAHNVAKVTFIIKDSEFIGAQLIGTIAIPAERIMYGQSIQDWYPVFGPNGKVCKAGAALKISIQFFPTEYESLYRFGIGVGPDYKGVPNTYFPLRKGGKLTLYQDAHVLDNLLPSIKLDHQVTHKHGKYNQFRGICA